MQRRLGRTASKLLHSVVMVLRNLSAASRRTLCRLSGNARHTHTAGPLHGFRVSIVTTLAAAVLVAFGAVSIMAVAPDPALAATTLAQTESELAAAKTELRARQSELDKLAQRYATAQDELATTEDRVTEVQAQADRAAADLEIMRARLNDRLRGMYMDGDAGGLAILGVFFDGDSLAGILNRLAMLGRVLEGDDDVLSQVELQVAKLDSLEAELSDKRLLQTEQLAEIDKANEAAMKALEDSKSEYNTLREKVARLQEEARKKREEAARLAAAAAAQSSGSSGSSGSTTGRAVSGSGWAFPVQGPNSFINDWGFARSGGRSHRGTDIMTARNTHVVAVVAGVIKRTSPTERSLGGITIWLDGGDGNSYYYAHLTSIASSITPGTRVSAGQVIGYAGNTGNARGGEVHLHFEIHPGGGSAINPYPTLVANR